MSFLLFSFVSYNLSLTIFKRWFTVKRFSKKCINKTLWKKNNIIQDVKILRKAPIKILINYSERKCRCCKLMLSWKKIMFNRFYPKNKIFKNKNRGLTQIYLLNITLKHLRRLIIKYTKNILIVIYLFLFKFIDRLLLYNQNWLIYYYLFILKFNIFYFISALKKKN